jgi:hypothetical protein
MQLECSFAVSFLFHVFVFKIILLQRLKLLAGKRGIKVRFFSSSKILDWTYNLPSLQYGGYRGISRGIKRPKLEYDRSFSSSAEIKNGWSYFYTPCIRLRGLYRNNFTFTKPQLRCDTDKRISNTPGEERVFLLPTDIQNPSLL